MGNAPSEKAKCPFRNGRMGFLPAGAFSAVFPRWGFPLLFRSDSSYTRKTRTAKFRAPDGGRWELPYQPPEGGLCWRGVPSRYRFGCSKSTDKWARDSPPSIMHPRMTCAAPAHHGVGFLPRFLKLFLYTLNFGDSVKYPTRRAARREAPKNLGRSRVFPSEAPSAVRAFSGGGARGRQVPRNSPKSDSSSGRGIGNLRPSRSAVGRAEFSQKP